MALNPFFLQGSRSEQNLVQDLINEQLRMYGVEVYYMPRQYITTNKVIREVIQSEFTQTFPIEAYVDSYEGYGGQGTLLTKFGIQDYDDLKIIISRERYETYIAPLAKDIPDGELTERPKEGDLIYFPLGDRIFEIKYVEHEQPFYQLQKNYVYTLTCSLFRIEDEVIDTGVEFIDDEKFDQGYFQTLTLIGAAVTGIATASNICALGGVQVVNITNMGNNYSTAPLVGFSSSPTGGTTTVGISSITNQFVNCSGFSGTGKVKAVYMSNSGCGYTVGYEPWVEFITPKGETGAGAAATTGIANGTIQTVSIANSGSGYTSDIDITFPAPVGGGTSATAIGFVNSQGNIDEVYLINAGAGYTSGDLPLFANIETPAGIGSTVGFGTYIYNEVVVGSISSTTGRVNRWIADTKVLEISIISGTFTPGEGIYGTESGALYALQQQIVEDLVTPYADNDVIEIAADALIDFTEKNPFGMP